MSFVTRDNRWRKEGSKDHGEIYIVHPFADRWTVAKKGRKEERTEKKKGRKKASEKENKEGRKNASTKREKERKEERIGKKKERKKERSKKKRKEGRKERKLERKVGISRQQHLASCDIFIVVGLVARISIDADAAKRQLQHTFTLLLQYTGRSNPQRLQPPL